MNAKTDSPMAVFPGASFASHMPFLRDNTLLFCQAGPPQQHTFQHGGTIWQRIETDARLKAHFANTPRSATLSFRRWKLSVSDWPAGQARRLLTGLPADAVECSPSFYVQDGVCHLSFIGGIPTSHSIEYRLYEMSGPTLGALGPAKPVAAPVTKVGFVHPRYICTGRGPSLYFRSRHDATTFELACPLGRIAHVSYRADDDDIIVITGRTKEGQFTTLLHHLATGDTSVVTSPDGVYKSTLYGDSIVYAKRHAGPNEDRDLWYGVPVVERSTAAIRHVASRRLPRARIAS